MTNALEFKSSRLVIFGVGWDSMSVARGNDVLSHFVRIRGACANNLQNVNLDIPRGQLVALTGVSGSGKSSLAVDTLFAEGQRQYFETLSNSLRQRLNTIAKPPVRYIDGLQPTICIEQYRAARNRRSTVATLTEIYDFLRLVMARVADLVCGNCSTKITQQTPDEILRRVMSFPQGTRLMILAPIRKTESANGAELIAEVRKSGLVRVRIDGQLDDVETASVASLADCSRIEAVVDRIVVREGVDDRLRESLELALKLGNGSIILSSLFESANGEEPAWNDEICNTGFACGACGSQYPVITPGTFSFNRPEGACKHCHGLGIHEHLVWERVFDFEKSMEQCPVIPWQNLPKPKCQKRTERLKKELPWPAEDFKRPLSDLDPQALKQLIDGGGEWPGLRTVLEKEWVTATDENDYQNLKGLRQSMLCEVCQGSRLSPHASLAKLEAKTISEIVDLTVEQAHHFFSNIRLSARQQKIGELPISEIRNRLHYLCQTGVGYLQLNRTVDTLSGGEHQRVRLATALGSSLNGVCYILDEPTVGLHPRDTQRMIDVIRQLNVGGNTIIIVEHDLEVINSCDYVVECGPGAGELGGKIIAQGSIEQIKLDPESITGRFLSRAGRNDREVNSRKENVHEVKTTATELGCIQVRGASVHNLRQLDVDIPLGKLVVISGVSGSGKSSLAENILLPNLVEMMRQSKSVPNQMKFRPEHCDEIVVPKFVEAVISVDQSPLGNNSRSNPASFSGMLVEVRKIFAASPDAKRLGFSADRFSLNTAAGRCAACQGTGESRLDLKFLPELVTQCSVCQGKRYNQQTLQVRYRGQTIANVLDMSFESAHEFFKNYEKINRITEQFIDVGLGYLRLGQPANKLSGGESQRIRLASELAKKMEYSHTIFLLDEPTTGLHAADVERLLAILKKLVVNGNSVIVIEHDLQIIRNADWIIDLGPEGGAEGGRVVAEGSPLTVSQSAKSITGTFLKS